MRSNCKGCWAEILERARSGPPSLRNLCRHHEHCPCCECLIKPICGQICQEYHDWISIFWLEGMENEA